MEWNHPYDKSVICTYNKQSDGVQCIKIFDMLHFPNFDFYYHMSYLNHKNITDLVQDDYARILLMGKNVPYNPKYLFVTLLYTDGEIVFGGETSSSQWIFTNNTIKHKSTDLFLVVINKKITLSKIKQKMEYSR